MADSMIRTTRLVLAAATRAAAALAIAALAAVLPLRAQTAAGPASTPNFSGFWTLDRAASDITPPAFSGGRGGAAIDRLFITHAANDTLIIGTETNGLKAWSYTPGQDGTIPVGRDTTMRAASRWEDGRLVVEGAQGAMRMREVLTLGPDGRHLTIRVTTTTPDGVTTNTLVYRNGQPVGPCETWAMPCKDFTDQQR